MKTEIFLDSGDPKETQEARRLFFGLGYLDGQTTNPTLIAKNPEVKMHLEQGHKFTSEEIYEFYRIMVQKVSGLIPDGSVSVEVYSDSLTWPGEMWEQAKNMNTWIPNAHIKLPITPAGLKTAEKAVMMGMRINMTLCFTQEQAAAVYAATRGAQPGQVFVSPFVGRWDDLGANGMDLVGNIIRMYRNGDGHVRVLTASTRSMGHILTAFDIGSDIITMPLSLMKEWIKRGMPRKTKDLYVPFHLDELPYKKIDLDRNWTDYDIRHRLTDQGLEKFAADWNQLIV